MHQQKLRPVKNADVESMGSKSLADINFPSIYRELSRVIFRKQLILGRNQTSNPRYPHQSAMIVPAYRNVSSPSRIDWGKHWIMRHQKL